MLPPVSTEAFKAASNEACRIVAERFLLEHAYPGSPCQNMACETPCANLPDMGAMPVFQQCSDHLLSL